MSWVNIPRTKEDPNYRYKMPKLLCRVEGRGNGVRTNVVNMGEIARALKRPPTYVTKFFGCEVGAISKFFEADDKALVNGSFTDADFIPILDKFITTYVLCEVCTLPETDIMVKKGRLVYKCNACGAAAECDNFHRAATFMIKNPPNADTSTMGKQKKSKEERRAAKGKKAADDGSDDKNGQVPDEVEEEKKKRKAKKRSVDDGTPAEQKDDKMGDEEVMAVEALMLCSPELDPIALRLISFARDGNVTPQDFSDELRNLQIAQDFHSACRIYIALAALFPGNTHPHTSPTDTDDTNGHDANGNHPNGDITTADTPSANGGNTNFPLSTLGDKFSMDKMEGLMPYLAQVIHDASVKPSYLLFALERWAVGHNDTQVTKLYPFIVEKLYRHDLLEGDDITHYYGKDKPTDPFAKIPGKTDATHQKDKTQAKHAFATCQKLSAPFTKWLNDAAESDDDE